MAKQGWNLRVDVEGGKYIVRGGYYMGFGQSGYTDGAFGEEVYDTEEQARKRIEQVYNDEQNKTIDLITHSLTGNHSPNTLTTQLTMLNQQLLKKAV